MFIHVNRKSRVRVCLDCRESLFLCSKNHIFICLQGAASNPNDSQKQKKLKAAAEALLVATNSATQNALRKKLLDQLIHASQQAITASTQVAVAASAVEDCNSNKATQHQLQTHVKVGLFVNLTVCMFQTLCLDHPTRTHSKITSLHS